MNRHGLPTRNPGPHRRGMVTCTISRRRSPELPASPRCARASSTSSTSAAPARIGTIEFEPGLEQDLPAMLDRLIPAKSRIRARTGVARRQWPLAFAGDAAWALAHRSHRGRQPGAGHLAADLPPRMRCPRAPAHRRGHGHGRKLSLDPAIMDQIGTPGEGTRPTRWRFLGDVGRVPSPADWESHNEQLLAWTTP